MKRLKKENLKFFNGLKISSSKFVKNSNKKNLFGNFVKNFYFYNKPIISIIDKNKKINTLVENKLFFFDHYCPVFKFKKKKRDFQFKKIYLKYLKNNLYLKKKINRISSFYGKNFTNLAFFYKNKKNKKIINKNLGNIFLFLTKKSNNFGVKKNDFIFSLKNILKKNLRI